MSDATPAPEAKPTPPPAQAASAATPPIKAEAVGSPPPAAETDWKAEARKWEQRAKENGTAADELQKIRDANLSDLEKAQKAASDAQAEAQRATHEALCLRIAAKHGISDEDADLFLTGSDAETLEKQATALAARTSTGTTPGPRPDLSQGSKGDPASPDQAAATWLQSLTRR